VEFLSTYEPEKVVGKVNVPVLFLNAKHDAVAPEALGEACAKAAPNGRLEVLPDCGHLIVLDQKAAFHERLRAFLQSI
jgi:non-heme chloroperoxidase